MKNGNDCAFPADSKTQTNGGLTKREYFAAKAMQGYVVQRNAQDDYDMQKIAKLSVKMADALLSAMEEAKSNQSK